ncbi:SDR family NAD(P)-dependent oxidoreductase [Phreatobacter aquaticus]|uniref:SDR family NAD(P)-dependent oxidoreductase n=1 Tax=Phreatobacter aquaticus TaxID=2570229 RepID=A0A4D7QL87_9HYPH|nr:SDR family NAD(P)-dependent oxidoreductase [Phreatobacter aquaticus]QCK86136.1 SDR family NAD(P)-dependent oxidoreductase [Phreatobacter aquaticus]
MSDLVERRAWITGAGKGIGRDVALLLARQGWVVAVSSRTDADLTVLAAEAAAFGGRIVGFRLDVTDESAVAAVVAQIEAQIGPLDLALLNAGTHIPVTAETFEVSAFRKLVETNLMGAVHGLAALLPRFMERGSGQIAVVASVAGFRGLPTSAAYGATKAALINMCEALKPELDEAGVDLRLICPGFVETPLTAKNTFPMPFLIPAERAAREIVDGLAGRKFRIVFPKRMAFAMAILEALPNWLLFKLTRRMVR